MTVIDSYEPESEIYGAGDWEGAEHALHGEELLGDLDQGKLPGIAQGKVWDNKYI